MADSILMILLDKTTDEEAEALIELYSCLIKYLSISYRVHDVRGYKQTLEALSYETLWRAVIVMEPTVVGTRYRLISDRLIHFARNGGTVIFEGRFGRLLRPQDLNAYFRDVWCIGWRYGAVSESWEYALNPASDLRRAISDQYKDMPRYYQFSGLLLANVAIQESVYLPKWPQTNERERRGPKMVGVGCMMMEYDSERWQNLTPVAFARYERGWIGWSGDIAPTGYNPSTIEVLGAMCGV
ncbi:hypothetical protein L211DRAFT_842888 [Terfezia boudieri ATCC MYA-4762]|uniref:Uncharacterized protein n=1 Tax=Terfezia boudieri ATCC MYA-4762 TaxID=1051890 RepID=A0A3N4L8H5_9PEZI|nr:hypothetical protein L211DRAFT_842888 [Terfezia boudieri ATCC MYA-4762]